MKTIAKKLRKKACFLLFFLCMSAATTTHLAKAAPDVPFSPSSTDTAIQNKYVGVEACVECHEEIVEIYRKTSGKAESDKSVLKMREKLTQVEFEKCLSCHTTGYGEPTGFVSFEKTPHLAEVGCESCHGMGYIHTQEASADSIQVKPTLELCSRCHDDTQVPRIHYDGRVHAGGH